MPDRSTKEVSRITCKLALAGDLETDLERSVSDGTVFLTSFGIFQGREGPRELAKLLASQVPGCRCNYLTRLPAGELAFLEWTANSEKTPVGDGADSCLIDCRSG